MEGQVWGLKAESENKDCEPMDPRISVGREEIGKIRLSDRRLRPSGGDMTEVWGAWCVVCVCCRSSEAESPCLMSSLDDSGEVLEPPGGAHTQVTA